MERSRVTYESTNQQLMGLITKISSQLARVQIDKTQPKKQQTPAPSQPSVSRPSTATSSSFRRQKAIRIKKRDSVKRNSLILTPRVTPSETPTLRGVTPSVGAKIDVGSCQSSDSGHFSDNDNNIHDNQNNNNTSLDKDKVLHKENASLDKILCKENTSLDKLLRKGLHLVNNVNHQLETKDAGELSSRMIKDGELSSRICGNSNKVIIKIGNNVGDTAPGDNGDNGHVMRGSQPSRPGTMALAPGTSNAIKRRVRADREIGTDSSGTISVPVPYNHITTTV